MYEVIILALVLAAAAVLPMLLVVPVALWEKRLVWPYMPLEDSASGAPVAIHGDPANPYAVVLATPDAPWPPLTVYAARAFECALSIGFLALGTFRDGKGRLYKVRYDFYLSPERDVLALVGSGTIASIPLNNTWLFTLLADGRCLRIVDTQPGSETDLAGLADEALITQVDFQELVARHRGRVAASFTPAAAYDDKDPLGDHRDFLMRRTDRLEELGFIRFLNTERTWWRYTLRGALLSTARAHFRGLRRAFWSDARLKPGAGKQWALD